jgi:broad-specificity NMP kinase
MKKSIFITGVAGSGKSSICKQLNILDYEAYDIEDIVGMFKMIRKDTGDDYEDYDNADIGKIKNADWICNKEKLKELVERQKKEKAFYCGIASNNDEIVSLFDKIILLRATPEVIHKRLSSREGTDDMGNTNESREWVLGWKEWWENKLMRNQNVLAVNADDNLADISKKIVELTK